MGDKLWFKAKRYGWGWYPCSWEGWLSILIYAICMILILSRLENHPSSAAEVITGYTIPIVIITAIFLEVCWKTGERPRWRWGN